MKKVCTTPMYNTMNHESHVRGENKDCTVKAVAVVCGLTYEVAHALCAKHGRRQGKGFGNWPAAVESAGFVLRKCNTYEEMISKYPAPHNTLRGATSHHPARFNKVWKNGKTYLMLVSGGRHILAIKDGANHDWTVGTAKRCCGLWEVIGK